MDIQLAVHWGVSPQTPLSSLGGVPPNPPESLLGPLLGGFLKPPALQVVADFG